MTRRRWRRIGGVALVLTLAAPSARAQFQMPDPKAMSGIPRPVNDLPDRTVSVRVIRGDMSNNLVNQPVEFTVDGKTQTVTTNETGRAELVAPSGGAVIKAATTVDGEHLESSEFPAPTTGGVRLLLVATDQEKEAKAAADAAAPAVPGMVVLAGETRLVMEPAEDNVRVYYLLDITNSSRTKVEPQAPFELELPTGAAGATLMEGSSPQANLTGTRLRVNGPFPPGGTFVQLGFVLPSSGGTLQLRQAFPANMERLGVIVQKMGDAKLSSPQIQRQQDMPAGNDIYIAAAGGSVPAGQPVELTVTGLPHHSSLPRYVALGLAATVIALGIVLGGRRDPSSRGDQRKQLVARREKLFQELVRHENDFRRGKVDKNRYAARREELLAALEHVYGALETDGSGPDPTGRTGIAA